MGGRWASWSRQSAWGEDGGESPPPVVTYSISGTITGDVVEGVTVTLSGDDSDSVVTGPSGAYSFEGLADGSYTVTPSLAGYGFTPAATNVTVSGADQTGKDFVSALLVYDISGAITGDEVEGVTVALTGDSSDSVVTGVGGTFTFADLPPGDYTLTPTLAGYTFAPASINVTIVAADQTDQDFVSSEITYTISGTIVDGAAAGIEGVTVALTGDATDSTTTAANGTYSFTGVVDGSYTVTPTLANLQMTPASRAAVVAGDDVALDNIVGQYFLLPWLYDVSDVAPSSGNIAGQLSEWVVAATANDGDIVSTGLADVNSFTPSGVTKAFNLVQANTEFIDQVFPYVIDPSKTSVRISFLIMDTSSDNRVGVMYYLDPVGTDQSQLLPNIDTNSSPDLDYMRSKYEDGITVTDSNASLGANIDSRRWHWLRYEWNWTDNKVRVQALRAEDSASIYSVARNMHASGIALGHVPSGLVRVRLGATAAGTNSLYAKLWIGTASDDWPI